jgi:regulatory protein YycI of two-component signal transduction system YycFG
MTKNDLIFIVVFLMILSSIFVTSTVRAKREEAKKKNEKNG